ncbi:MAG: hypothetical protein R3C55_14500 [Parvularculaceae bacterium]
MTRLFSAVLAAVIIVFAAPAMALPEGVDARSEGEGPFNRLVIRGATLIDGSGAPPFGPVDIVVVNDKIAEIVPVGAPGVAIDPQARPAAGAREIDASGKYVLPGLVNLHGHIHAMESGQHVPPDYIFKLWMMHGITTVREVGNEKGASYSAALAAARARNEIKTPPN